MNNLFFDLVFTTPKKNDPPSSPIAQVGLKSYGVENDRIIIGEKCVNFEELDKHIVWLEQELNNIRKKARAKFSS